MNKIAVIDIVGLSSRLIGDQTPFLKDWLQKKSKAIIEPVLPAVTCSTQSTYLTGKWPSEHGIVGNGWYFREEDEVRLWRQSNQLVQAKKVWEKAKEKDPSFTCANMFWWYNMNTEVDYAVTPRPQYRADGQKKPDCYSKPADLRDRLQKELGVFPLFHFWGPRADILSSQWIADATVKTIEWHDPTLTLVYLPHLDYCLQKFGPGNAKVNKELKNLDQLCEQFFSKLEKQGREIIVLSEYGITPVNQPVHINRELRKAGLLNVRVENGLELLDPSASLAFAMSDHQIAHVYIHNQKNLNKTKASLQKTQGIAEVLDKNEQKKYHLDHPRSGDLVCVAEPHAWFTYYYWLDDQRAPDFARTVDIHKKPGYDPVEMFTDPRKKFMLLRILLKLIRKKLGFRVLMDLIPLDASLIQGSHGQINLNNEDKPIWIGEGKTPTSINPTRVSEMILNKIFIES